MNKDNAPTPEAAACLPADLETPPANQIEKTIVIFHDESTFQSCDYERTQWGSKDDHMLVPKSRGAGIMVSDFITEKDGYLKLTDSEFAAVSVTEPGLVQSARATLEYGESKDGYWTSAKFMDQLKYTVKLA